MERKRARIKHKEAKDGTLASEYESRSQKSGKEIDFYTFYVQKHKEHEARAASTDDRQEFWKQWTISNESKDSQE